MTQEEKMLYDLIAKIKTRRHKLLQRAAACTHRVEIFENILRDKYSWRRLGDVPGERPQ